MSTTNPQDPRRSIAIFLVLLFVFAPATPVFAAKNNDDKRSLYNKGVEAVSQGDAISARDAFCEIARRDDNYGDAKTQCQTYSSVAQRALLRYKINYAEGITLLAAARFEEAAARLHNVRGGEYADVARQKLSDIPKLRAEHNAAIRSSVEQMLNVGESGKRFAAVCGRNDAQAGSPDPSVEPQLDPRNVQLIFCDGWVRGASETLRAKLEGVSRNEVCMPAGVAVERQTSLLLEYIEAHPEQAGTSASALFRKALSESFPCRVERKDDDASQFESP